MASKRQRAVSAEWAQSGNDFSERVGKAAEVAQIVAHRLVQSGHEVKRLWFPCQLADGFVVKPYDDATDNPLGIRKRFTGHIHYDDALFVGEGKVTPVQSGGGFQRPLQFMPPCGAQTLIADFYARLTQTVLNGSDIRRTTAGIAQNDVGAQLQQECQELTTLTHEARQDDKRQRLPAAFKAGNLFSWGNEPSPQTP